MATLQGGTGDGRPRDEWAESKKPKSTWFSSIALTHAESQLRAAIYLLSFGGHKGDGFDWGIDLANVTEKNATKEKELIINPEEGTITFHRSVRLAETYGKVGMVVPGIVSIIDAAGSKDCTIVVKPSEVITFLESDPVKALLQKCSDHEKKISEKCPAEYAALDSARQSKISGIPGHKRAEIVTLLSTLKKFIIGQRRGTQEHDSGSIGQHKAGGIAGGTEE